MKSAELQLLLEQYLEGTISDQDFKRMWETLAHEKNDADWLVAIENAIADKAPAGLSDPYQARQALANIKARISGEAKRSLVPTKRISTFYTKNIALFRIAAAVLVIAGSAILVLTTTKNHKHPTQTMAGNNLHNDVRPGARIAMLTLADGTTIDLENAGNGKIAQQGNVQVFKLANGELQYKIINDLTDKKILNNNNTMSTPRGGQYQLLLPDGSKVWLNAESSITYPVLFAENERKVKITGEVYFEVAKDKNKPFRVIADDVNIEVLGTHFNVNAYKDDGPVKTTLLEGSVRINEQVIKPGQAFLNGKIVSANVEQDIAWKNGVFNFNDKNLSQIMLQLSRWYDVEVIFPQGIPQKQYGGEIGRNLNLSQVLKGLENSGVHFELQGKRLIVKP